MKIILQRIEDDSSYLDVYFLVVDPSQNQSINTGQVSLQYGVDITLYTPEEIQAAASTKILAYAVSNSYSVSASDIVFTNLTTLTPVELLAIKAGVQSKTFTNNPTHSFVTTAAAANGFQLSATRDAVASYSVQISTTASIGGNASGYVALEIAATNSTTAADWKEIGRVTNSQALSLAIVLQSVQVSGGILMGVIPAGYYVRLRTVNVSGTPTYTYNSGQEVLI